MRAVRFGAAIAVAMSLASCSSETRRAVDSPGTAPAASTHQHGTDPAVSVSSVTEPITSAESTAPPIADPSTTSSADVPVADQPCALTAAPGPASSTLTVERGGQLLEVVDGAAVCLKQLGADETGPLAWSPAGSRALLGPAVVFDGSGSRPSGYFADNVQLRWSWPTGKSLIAPTSRDGGAALIKRDATSAATRTDITFLTRTDAVAYHPAGLHIFASGLGPQGEGLYLASNLGANPRMIAQILQPDTRITEIAAPPAGNSVVFVHDHGSFRHLHRLTLPDLTLADLLTTDDPLAELRVADGQVAVRAGDCATGTVARAVYDDGSSIDVAVPGKWVSPVGWDGVRLVVAVRAGGCDGPADVFTASFNDGQVTLAPVISGVDAAAMRTNVGDVGPFPGEVINQAPG